MRWRVKYVVLALAGALVLFCLSAYFASSRGRAIPLTHDQIVSEVGRYAFDGDTHGLDITTEETGESALSVLRYPPDYWENSNPYPVFELKIPESHDWFFALDELQRVWIFVGPKAIANQDVRAAKPAAVYRFGRAFSADETVAVVTEQVTASGRWEEVPATFLNRVRNRIASDDRLKAIVPAASPRLTHDQRRQILESLHQAG